MNPRKYNVITGFNASGKTNLLEAIHSLNHNLDLESSKRNGVNDFVLHFVFDDDSEVKIFSANGRKKILFQNKEISSIKLQNIISVMYINTHLYYNFFHSLEKKREIFDRMCSMYLQDNHLGILNTYKKYAKKRLDILKLPHDSSTAITMLDAIERKMSEYCIILTQNRITFRDYVNSCDTCTHSINIDIVDNIYISFEECIEKFRQNRSIDAKSQRTFFSAHRFDLKCSILIEGVFKESHLLSNSQKKFFMNLIIFRLLKASNSKKKLLLIDEYSSFFDEKSENKMTQEIFDLDVQVFLADTEIHIDNPDVCKINLSNDCIY